MNSLDVQGFLHAWYILQPEAFVTDIELQSNSPTPEEEYFKKSMFEQLSNDAKFIVNLALDTPKELVSDFGRLSKTLLRRYLRYKEKWTVKRVELAIAEITEYVS